MSAAWSGPAVGSALRGSAGPVEVPTEWLATAGGGALGLEAMSRDLPHEFGLQRLGQLFWCQEPVEGPW
ncbi:hypothetical protein NDU88_005749 [Pleurodeles waltl]|uniref:Uncharacterized protein n=1 Tax=Pleurodeles waltl TaxID=8319 RepID=A0AAV7VP95_PLEWA|nr:hypothetical protein NDU88_005749 [Pleurodeles waltl]